MLRHLLDFFHTYTHTIVHCFTSKCSNEKANELVCFFFFFFFLCQTQEDRSYFVLNRVINRSRFRFSIYFQWNRRWMNSLFAINYIRGKMIHLLCVRKIFFFFFFPVISSCKFHGIKLLLSVRGNCPLWNWTLWCFKVLNETRNMETTRRKKFL